jgi:hypothetical protein
MRHGVLQGQFHVVAEYDRHGILLDGVEKSAGSSVSRCDVRKGSGLAMLALLLHNLIAQQRERACVP